MDNLRVITVLGAFGGGVQGGNGGNDTPVGTEDLACGVSRICNGKRYILSASKLMCDKGCTSFSFYDNGVQVACGAQAEIWIDNTGDQVNLQWPEDWLWANSDGITYVLAGAGESDTHAAETKCNYMQVITIRHDGRAVLANLAYQYAVDNSSENSPETCC